MSLFERYLSLWVALCILAGLVLGNLLPVAFAALAGLEYASVNLVVAVLIWAMVYPMIVAVDLGSLKSVVRVMLFRAGIAAGPAQVRSISRARFRAGLDGNPGLALFLCFHGDRRAVDPALGSGLADQRSFQRHRP